MSDRDPAAPTAPASADAPERIYLQVCDDDTCGEPFSAHEYVTWCEDQVSAHDIEYLRADAAAAALRAATERADRLAAALKWADAHVPGQVQCEECGYIAGGHAKDCGYGQLIAALAEQEGKC